MVLYVVERRLYTELGCGQIRCNDKDTRLTLLAMLKRCCGNCAKNPDFQQLVPVVRALEIKLKYD